MPFSHADFMQDVREARSSGIKNIALNLKTTRFLNLSAIKFCVELAQELAEEGGRFAFVACSERTKRHFEIYGSLDEVRLVRDVDELEKLRPVSPRAHKLFKPHLGRLREKLHKAHERFCSV